MPPYAYLRKSRVFRDRRAVSPEMQLDEVRRLAAAHGDSDLVVLEDMGISGRKGRAGRPGFAALLDAIGQRHATAVYSYSLSRLSRSMRDILDLAETAGAMGVPIRLVADPDPDPTSPSGKLILTILAAMAAFEADVASERARDTAEARRARGEKMGPAYFDRPELVIRAWERAGSFIGAARLLNAEGVKTQRARGTRRWQPTTVREIVRREVGVEAAPRGPQAPQSFIFARLLRCHCGRMLTGVRMRNGSDTAYVAYRCLQGRIDPERHPRQSVPETAVMAWAREEAALLEIPLIQRADSIEGRRDALREDLRKLGVAYRAGAVADADFESEADGYRKALEALDLEGRVVDPGQVDWDQDPATVNRTLRAIWRWVELDDWQRPSRAEWRVPAWRRAG